MLETEPTEVTESSLIAFAEELLGLDLYDWQTAAISPFDFASKELVQVSLATPNGSGKSAVVITTLVLGWLALYPQGIVVLTTADGKQIDGQVMPALHRHRAKFQEWDFTTRGISTPTGGLFVAFTTDQAGRAEGWHKVNDNTGPLLMIVDEAKSVPEDIFQSLDRCTYNAILLTSSPGKMSGTFYESQFNPKLKYDVISVGLKDCPHITQDKIDRIIAKHGASSPFARSSLHGEFLESWDGKPVYYAYNQDIHEGEDLPWPMGAYLAIGSDVGTHAATTWSAYWKENGIEYWHVLYEFYADGFDADRHAREIIRITENEFPFHNDRGVCSGVLHYVDPAAANSSYTRQINVDGKDVKESALNIFRTYGIYPGFTTTGRGLQETIAIVNRLMDARDPSGRPTFRVDSKSCPRLARGFRGGYRWPEGTEKTEQNLPLKGIACDHLDHCFTAGTMILTTRGEIAIETVVVGDMVLTRNGAERVVNTMTRDASVRTYVLDDGRTIESTDEHPVWSDARNAWIPIAEAMQHDTLRPCTHAQSRLSSTGGFIAATLTVIGAATACISSTTQRIFTTLFGRRPTDQDQRDITSTIGTETPATTLSTTFSFSPQSSTSERPTHRQSAEPRRREPSSWQSPQRPSGTLQMMEKGGTSNRRENSDLENSSPLPRSATTADDPTICGQPLESWQPRASAQMPASLRPAARAVWTTWIAFARYAARRSEPTAFLKSKPAHVVAVDRQRRCAPVFNITVENQPEYFANGILVHNCQDAFRYAAINTLRLTKTNTARTEPATPWNMSKPKPANPRRRI